MQQSILFCLIVVKCEKISVEYGVIFLILQQVRRATSWVPAGRMLCTPDPVALILLNKHHPKHAAIRHKHPKKEIQRLGRELNALSSRAPRTEEDCRKKWKDLKSASMKLKVDVKKTGGGPAKQAPYNDIIAAIVGITCALDGIEGMLLCLQTLKHISKPELSLMV